MEKIEEIDKRLGERYGAPRPRPRRDPLTELVHVILSQNTNDTNRDRAFAALRARFKDWGEVLSARPSAVARAIQVGGLGNIKAARIKGILKEVQGKFGRLSLNLLKDMEVEEARRLLLSFKGVGPKTAACVLLFSLKKPAFPVDTHIYRVGKRLGLIPKGASPERAHQVMEGMIRPERYFPLHINLINLGRELCHPRRPECPRCPLSQLCPSAVLTPRGL